MERYFLNSPEYKELYNCSMFSVNEWYKHGAQNPYIAITYITIGLIYEILYIPCLNVMMFDRFIHLSCYKIMFFLGVVDVSCILINSLLSGYFSAKGSVYCTDPELMYVSGAISTALWCSACMGCMILAFNRCIDLYRPLWMPTLFKGYRTYMWLILPCLYGTYFLIFTPPLIYSSVYSGAFFDPYVGTEFQDKENQKYTNWPHTFNNVTVIVVLCSAYTSLCIFIFSKTKNGQTGNQSISTLQRQIVIQAVMICLLNLVAAVVYVLMQFVNIPMYLVVVGQITWQSSHGGAVFIYIFLNKSMRRAIVKRYLLNDGTQTSIQVFQTGTSGTPAKGGTDLENFEI